jgi:hypothetical protein
MNEQTILEKRIVIAAVCPRKISAEKRHASSALIKKCL